MPLPLARPDANEVVLVAGPDPLDPARWLYVAERAGDGPGCAEVLESGGWADLGDGLSLLEQVPYALRLPVPVVLAGFSWCDANVLSLPTDEAVRLSWRLPEEG